MNNRTFGMIGEDIAVKYLKEKGYRIIAQNYNTQNGELDIVALRKQILVFVEVKTVSSLAYGYPWQRISEKKRRSLRRASYEFCKLDGIDHKVPYYYRKDHRIMFSYYDKRFDLIEIVASGNRPLRISHTENFI